jgi:hypothetical protein
MAIEISQNTVVKILVRRGTDTERKQVVLSEGELGYSVDTRRVFVGDGITQGGVVVGNRYLGKAQTKEDYTSIAQTGDIIYQTGDTYDFAQVLYGYNGSTWENIHPLPYSGQNTVASLEKSPTGYWRVSNQLVGIGSGVDSGLTLVYDDSLPADTNSITNIKNRIDFDSRYISLCATNNSWYIGDIKNTKVKNNFNARLNVDNSIFVNDNDSNPYQLQLLARDPYDENPGASLIKAVSGGLNISGATRTSLVINNNEAVRVAFNSNINTVSTIISSGATGTYENPNFRVINVSRFDNDAYFGPSADVTIMGNLSVYGDITYLDTIVSTTSALSVVNLNDNQCAMVVAQLSDEGDQNQTIAKFMSRTAFTDSINVLSIKEQGYVGINQYNSNNFETYNGNYAFAVSGGVCFTKDVRPGVGGTSNKFQAIMGENVSNDDGSRVIFKAWSITETSYTKNLNAYNINFTTPIGGSITLGGTSIVLDTLGAQNGYVDLRGNLRATKDVIAYYTSDINLKTNIKIINDPKNKINQISGITFDWNENADRTGTEYGVIAQEIEKVLPHCVVTRDNGYKAVKYDNIIPLLIEAIKDIYKRIE